MNFDKIKSAIRIVAPAIASVIGTPVAGVAVSALCNLLLGKSSGTDDELTTALASASPDTLLKLKQLEADTQTKLAELGIEQGKLDESYVQDARQRETDIAKATGKRDWFPPALAIFIIFSCFASFIFYMKYGDLLNADIRPTIEMLMNNLITWVALVIGYYFGSSHGAAKAATQAASATNK